MDASSNYLSSLSSIRERLSSIEKRETPLKSKMTPPLSKTRSRRRQAVAPLPDVSLTPIQTKKQNIYRTPIESQSRVPLGNSTPPSTSTSTSHTRTRNFKSKEIRKSKVTSTKKKRATSTRKVQKVQVPTQVEFRTILRIRPLNSEEKGEDVILSVPESTGRNRINNLKSKTHGSRIIHLQPLKAKASATPHQHASKSDPAIASPMKFHFDSIIESDNSQKEMYQDIDGPSMAKDAVKSILFHSASVDRNGKAIGIEAKNHVVISMGVSNSGKTFTLLGDEHGSVENDGILPRLIDDLFNAGNDECIGNGSIAGSSSSITNMEVELSMVHIHNDKTFDMLSTTDNEGRRASNVSRMIDTFEVSRTASTGTRTMISKSMQEIKIFQDKTTQDFNVKPNVARCPSASEARKVLSEGLKQNTVASTKFNSRSSRGHTIITLRPTLRQGTDDESSRVGASITIIDMAGIERTRSSDMNRIAMRESAAINSTISAVLQCLRVIKANQETSNLTSSDNGEKSISENINSSHKRKTQLIPYRQNKLTMLMQPLFSGSVHRGSMMAKTSTDVKLLLSVYPGIKDYNEKKSLLSDLHQLRGLSVEGSCTMQHDCASSSRMNLNSSEESCDKSVDSPDSDKAITRSQSEESKGSTDEENNPPTQSSTFSDVNSYSSRSPLQRKSPLDRFVHAVKPRSSKKRKAEVQTLHERIHELEAENEALKCKAEKAKKQCISLNSENASLKQLIHEAEQREERLRLDIEEKGRDMSAPRDKRADDAELLQAREWRWKQQNLLGSPTTRHMRTVEGTRTIFTGRVGTQLMTRSPFKLTALMKSKRETPNQDQSCSDLESLEYASA
jgi:hypothetical protein